MKPCSAPPQGGGTSALAPGAQEQLGCRARSPGGEPREVRALRPSGCQSPRPSSETDSYRAPRLSLPTTLFFFFDSLASEKETNSF